MADEPIPAVSTEAPQAAADTPIATSAGASVETPAVVETPVVATEAEPIQRADAEPTLLEGVKAPGKEDAAKTDTKPIEGDKPAAKPSDKAPDVKAEEAKAPEPAKPAPVDYKYTVPETLKIDDAAKGELHSAFDAFRADPANPQPLIDLHNKHMSAFAENTLREQHRQFAETRQSWRKEVLADPEMGGAGHQTAMQAVARMRDMFISDSPVGSPQYQKDAADYGNFLRITGAGDNPAHLRFMHRMARFFDEPSLPPPDAKPTPNNGRPGKASDVLYDNPRSNSNGRQ